MLFFFYPQGFIEFYCIGIVIELAIELTLQPFSLPRGQADPTPLKAPTL